MRALLFPGLISAGFVLVGGAQDAQACSALACVDAYSLPAAERTVPANVPGLLLRPMADRTTRPPAGDFLLELETVGSAVTVFVEHFENSPAYLVRPDRPLVPNTDYVLRAENLCEPNNGSTSIPFRTGDMAALPTRLGRLELTAPEVGSVNVAASAQCTVGVRAAYSNVSLVLSDDAEPWAEVLVYETFVDGVAWRPISFLPAEIPVGASWRGRARDALYAPCDPLPLGASSQSLTEGVHEVVMRAKIPGTALLLETPAVRVNLSCTPQETPPEETPPEETPPEETPDPSGQNPGEAQPGSLALGRGCACSGAETGAPQATWVAMLAVAALAFTRRRPRAATARADRA